MQVSYTSVPCNQLSPTISYPGSKFWRALPLVDDIHIAAIGTQETKMNWKDLELSVPSCALPANGSVKVALYRCDTPPFRLPTGLQLVSPVYLVIASPETTLKKPLRLTLRYSAEHLGDGDSCKLALNFVSTDITDQAPEARTMHCVTGGVFRQTPSSGSLSMLKLNVTAIAIAAHLSTVH